MISTNPTGRLPEPVFHFGRHKNRPLANIPGDYLLWALKTVKLTSRLREAVRPELTRRGAKVPASPPASPRACPQCGGMDIQATWRTASNGALHIRGTCHDCGAWCGSLPQTPENVRAANGEPGGGS